MVQKNRSLQGDDKVGSSEAILYYTQLIELDQFTFYVVFNVSIMDFSYILTTK